MPRVRMWWQPSTSGTPITTRADLVLVQHHAVGQDVRRFEADLQAGARDEDRDDQRADRVEHRVAELDRRPATASTAHDVSTSLRVCAASASSSSLLSARPCAAS